MCLVNVLYKVCHLINVMTLFVITVCVIDNKHSNTNDNAFVQFLKRSWIIYSYHSS